MKKGRRMLALLLSLALIVSMVLPSTNAFAEEVSDVIITNLKTNDMVDPVGVDVIPPTFSWQMQSNTVGQKQTAYSIMVAKNPEFNQHRLGLWQDPSLRSRSASSTMVRSWMRSHLLLESHRMGQRRSKGEF